MNHNTDLEGSLIIHKGCLLQSTWNLGTNPLAKVSLQLEGCLEKAENKERRGIHMVSMVSTAKANQDI
jgi:hypothetical protein